MKKPFAAALAALALLLSACGSSADMSPNNTAISVVVDVRTAAEFAEGHVAGAINIDVEAPGFAEAIAGLDPTATYLLYCRSGRRSAIAAGQMSDAGLTVLDGGSLAAMLERGWQLGA